MSILLTVQAAANVVGTNTQNFNTTASSNDYVTVYSSKNLGAGVFSLGLFVNNAVNSLPYFEDASNDDEEYAPTDRSTYNDSLVGAELGIGLGILDNVDLGINIPGIVYQDLKAENETHGEFSKKGISEVRVGSKIGLYKNSLVGFALAGSTNINTTKSDPYSGRKPGPSYNAEMISDIQLGHLSLAANIGYRWKNPGKKIDEETIDVVEPTKNQVIGSVAAGMMLPPLHSQLVAEVFSAAPTQKEKDLSDRHTTIVESLIGLKVFAPNNFIYHVGGGTELRQSVSSADWRLYAGINWQTTKGPPSPRKPMIVEPPKPEPTPKPTSVPKEEPDDVLVVHDLLFKFNSDVLVGQASYEYLAGLAKSLNKRRIKRLIIEGHTCSMGSEKYNTKLSERRANRIRSLLIKNHKMDASKIFAVGVGEKHPLASNKTNKGREANRRVEFKVFYYEKNNSVSSVKLDQP